MRVDAQHVADKALLRLRQEVEREASAKAHNRQSRRHLEERDALDKLHQEEVLLKKLLVERPEDDDYGLPPLLEQSR